MGDQPNYAIRSKNLVLIVGNGFDLAHGMNTRYTDFAKSYIDRAISELWKIFNREPIKNSLFKEEIIEALPTNQSLNVSNNIFLNNLRNAFQANQKIETIENYVKPRINELAQTFKNSFLARLFGSQHLKEWNRVEEFYFDALLTNRQYKNLYGKIIWREEGFKILNEQFEEIKSDLIVYLKNQKSKKDKGIEYFFENLRDYYYDNIVVVNFNYTTTIKNYSSALSLKESTEGIINNISPKIYNIHGTIESGNIIFGYGNDKNSDYIDLRDTGINTAMDHMKTFDYSKNSIYTELLEYLAGLKEYEVGVIGHSLSSTDKTLLAELLNKELCKQIHFFKRTDILDSSSNFRDMLIATARIIEDEGDLRKRITPYSRIQTFP